MPLKLTFHIKRGLLRTRALSAEAIWRGRLGEGGAEDDLSSMVRRLLMGWFSDLKKMKMSNNGRLDLDVASIVGSYSY